MVKQRISGSVSADGTASGGGFTVTRNANPSSYEGRRVWKVTVSALSTLDVVEDVVANASRQPDPNGPSSSSLTGLREIDLGSKSFVVVAGYTAPPSSPAGHQGFTFVAVGDPGSGA